MTAKDAVTVGEEPCYILASGKTDSFAAAKTRSYSYPRERFPAMAKAVVAAAAMARLTSRSR